MSWLEALAPQWQWLIAAAVLAIAEMIAPGFFLIWIGAAALVTGVAALLGLPLTAQFVLFGVSAIALVLLGRRYFTRDAILSADPQLNNRVARLIGEIVVAVEPVDDAHGRVKVHDGVWSARGGPAEIGERLRVTGSDKNVLIVERV